VAKDVVAARTWLQQAADQGHQLAADRLRSLRGDPPR